MPTPKKGQSEKDFLKVCIPQMIDEGKEQDQAVAICFSIYREKGDGAKSPKPKKEEIMKRERYVSLFEQKEFEEAVIIGKKPSNEGGKYKVEKRKVRDPKNPKKFVMGWVKTKKAGKQVDVKSKTGKTKVQLKVAALKAKKTRKQGGEAAKKKAQKKRKKTLAMNV
jgi:hypothetical protein